MKYPLWLLCGVCLLLAFTNKGENSRSLTYFELNGPVRSVTETSYTATLQNGKVIKGGRQLRMPKHIEYDMHLYFNTKGQTTEYSEYDADGKLHSKFSYSYNAEDSLTRVSGPATYTDFEYNDDDKLWRKSTCQNDDVLQERIWYMYDKQGQVLKSILMNNSGQLMAEFWQYDKHQQKTLYAIYGFKYWGDIDLDRPPEISLDADNQMVLWPTANNPKPDWGKYTTYTYNKQGQLTQQTDGNLASGLLETFSYQYDKAGNLISQCITGPHNDTTSITTFTYIDGRLSTKRELKEGQENIMKLQLTTYNDQGKPASFRSSASGDTIPYLIYNMQYDKLNQLISTKTCLVMADATNCNTEQTIYRYDEHHNWISKAEFKNDSTGYLVERQISYYR